MQKRNLARVVAALSILASLATVRTTTAASIVPARNQAVERVDTQTSILDGKFVMVTYADDILDPQGKVVSTTKRQAILPANAGQAVATTPVQVQTVSGQLATILLPTDTLGEQLKKVAASANVVRILTVDGRSIEQTAYAAQKGFHFAMQGVMYDTPWNQDDGKRMAEIAEAGRTQKFRDVTSGKWSEGAIYTLVSKGIVHGIGDGQFAPTAPVTRAAFLTMLAGVAGEAGFDLSQKATVPSDTPDWAKGTASQIKAYLNANESGSFDSILKSKSQLKPNQPISRAEAAQIMSFFVRGEGSGAWPFADWKGGVEKARVLRLVQVGGISGVASDTFGADDTLTREQMASMAARLLYVN